jgi:osmotically-inducible protein OsmY
MRGSAAGSIRFIGLAAAAAAAWTCPTASAASASAAAGNGVYYSESVGVNTPDEHITGSTSSRDAQGAPLKEEQALLDKVMTALLGDSQLHGADIHVRVEKDRVVLTGHAKDTSQADHARDVAQNAATGAQVQSELHTG